MFLTWIESLMQWNVLLRIDPWNGPHITGILCVVDGPKGA